MKIRENIMGRYSDIRRGVELNAALTKLRAWEDKPREQKQTLYKQQRGTSIKVQAIYEKGYVESFQLNGRIFLPVKILSDTQTGSLGGATTLIGTVRTAAALNDRTNPASFTAPSGATTLDGLKGFKAARFGLVQRGASVTDNKSRITDVEYKRYDNKSVSSPFGSASAGNELYTVAVGVIKDNAAIKTFLETVGNRIYFTPEIV